MNDQLKSLLRYIVTYVAGYAAAKGWIKVSDEGSLVNAFMDLASVAVPAAMTILGVLRLAPAKQISSVAALPDVVAVHMDTQAAADASNIHNVLSPKEVIASVAESPNVRGIIMNSEHHADEINSHNVVGPSSVSALGIDIGSSSN